MTQDEADEAIEFVFKQLALEAYQDAGQTTIGTLEPTKHANCRCSLEPPRQNDFRRGSFDSLGAKLAARLLLADRLAGVVVPSRDEWIGLNLLERDGEL